MGRSYLPEEAMKVSIKNSTQSVSTKIKLMIKYKYVPVYKSVLYKLLSKYTSSRKIDDEWHLYGHRPVITQIKFDQSIDR